MTAKAIITKDEFYTVVKRNKGLLMGIPETPESLSEYYLDICEIVTAFEFMEFVRKHRKTNKFWPSISDVMGLYKCNNLGKIQLDDIFGNRLEDDSFLKIALDWCVKRYPNCKPLQEGTFDYDQRTEEQIKWKAIEQKKAFDEFDLESRKDPDFYNKIKLESNNLIEHKQGTMSLADTLKTIDFGVHEKDEIVLLEIKN